jgi:PAS domain S-box-containing protein
MSSKISKQKQIFSILTNKFGDLWENPSGKDDSFHKANKEEFSDSYTTHLINKVYNFYKSIIQNLGSGLIAIDLHGEITFVNDTASKILDYEKNRLLGKNVKELFADDESSQKCFRTIFLPSNRVEEREVNFLNKDGELIQIGLSSSPIHDDNNKFDGIILLFRDLTEVRQLKIQVERIERLALLGELSAGIAHEIRNPLAGIRAAAQILQEGISHNDFDKEIIERIIREVDKANKLLKEFFKFAKPSKPNLKFYDIEQLIQGVNLLLSLKMQNNNIKFKAKFNGKVPKVCVDDTQLEQVMINLFLNAIDAMPKGGVLSVSTQAKKIDLIDDGKGIVRKEDNHLNYVLVDVSDTGMGISERNLDKIFNPFFTTKPSGLGLGLSICNRLINENGGNIDVQSEIAKGTTFKLVLPAFMHH